MTLCLKSVSLNVVRYLKFYVIDKIIFCTNIFILHSKKTENFYKPSLRSSVDATSSNGWRRTSCGTERQVDVCVYLYMCVYLYIYVYMYIYLCSCTSVYVPVHMCVYLYIY